MSTNKDTKTIRFRCPHCEVILRGTAEDGGSLRNCPRCRKEFRVPTPRSGRPKNTPKPKQPHDKDDRDALPVVCTVCQTRMYAFEDQIGQLIECPDCFTQNLVKDVPQKKRTKVPSSSDGFSYDLRPAEDLKVGQSHVQELMKEADRIVEQQAEEEPEVPDRPLVTGVWLFAFTGKVFPLVLGMTLAWTVVLALIQFAWNLEGATSLVAPFLWAGSGIGILLVSFPTLVCWQKIFEFTAVGDEDSEYRPEGGMFNFVDWVMDVIPLILAVCAGVTPGMIILRTLGLPTPFVGFVVLAASLLFPLLLLSMLETASLAGLYSKPIFSSLFQQLGAWVKFYALGSLLVLIAAAAIIGILRLFSAELGPLMIAGGMSALLAALAALTTYFRLLGRHAFALIQEIEVEEPESDDLDENPSGASKVSLGV